MKLPQALLRLQRLLAHSYAPACFCPTLLGQDDEALLALAIHLLLEGRV